MPPREITATSVVPPPMSTTMLPVGSLTGRPGADRRGHRLLDDVDAPRPGLVARLLDRALLHAGDAARHRDDDPRLGQVAALVHLLDEIPEHSLGDVEVRDHPVLEWPDRHDVAGRPADHAFGLDPDSHNLAGVGVQRHHGRLVEHDPAAPHVDQGVRGAKVDRHIAAQERQRVAHVEQEPSEKGPTGCSVLLLKVRRVTTLRAALFPSSTRAGLPKRATHDSRGWCPRVPVTRSGNGSVLTYCDRSLARCHGRRER